MPLNKYTRCTIKEAENAEELLRLISCGLYDAIFIDHSLPPHNGFETFAQLSASSFCYDPVIMFGSDSDKHKVIDALIKGVSAFFSWHDEPQHILHTVHEVLQRGVYISHEQMQEIRRIEERRRHLNKMPKLTKREKEELPLLAKGYSTKQIANMLFISHRTAGNYRNNLLRKTGTRNTTSLLNFAKEAGWLDEERSEEF